MDIRIVNTCNNKCLYCLEQWFRKRKKFIDTQTVFDLIKNNRKTWDKIMMFYGGNSLLHPDLYEIIDYCRSVWFTSIWIITNWFWLNQEKINVLISKWITSIWIYFNSFNEEKHNQISWWGISLNQLINIYREISTKNIYTKLIININNLNIVSLYNDIIILNKKFWFKYFELINYFPFSIAYKSKNILWFSYDENRKNIDKLLSNIDNINIWVEFYKFDKAFFWKFEKFYNFERWILWQIGEEDVKRLEKDKPYCLIQKRCKYCFIKDNCKFYV